MEPSVSAWFDLRCTQKSVPSFSRRIERGLQPAHVARLILVVQPDAGDDLISRSIVHLERDMAAVIPALHRDALRANMNERLTRRQ